jgi:hypothetical protein
MSSKIVSQIIKYYCLLGDFGLVIRSRSFSIPSESGVNGHEQLITLAPTNDRNGACCPGKADQHGPDVKA